MSEAYKEAALDAWRRIGKLEAELKRARQDAQADLLKLIEDVEESLTADGTYALLVKECRAAIAKARGEASA